MNTKLIKNLFRASVVATALMSVGLTHAAFAATSAKVAPPPPKLVVPVVRAPITLSMAQFDQRTAKLPQLASAQNGDVVNLSDDGSVTDSIWQGRYVYRPAGSIVSPYDSMYARWQDGVVALTPTPNPIFGQPALASLDASFIQQNSDGTQSQTIRTLVPDGSDGSVLRIPDNAWLFRINSNGQYVALVDMFVYQSGSQPVPDQPDSTGTLPAATGSQPVPVDVGM